RTRPSLRMGVWRECRSLGLVEVSWEVRATQGGYMGRRSGIWTRLVLSLLCFFPMLGATAHADSILDFGIVTPTTGSISYAGGAAPLVGLGIDVDLVTGLPSGTSAACVGCVLNFITGI